MASLTKEKELMRFTNFVIIGVLFCIYLITFYLLMQISIKSPFQIRFIFELAIIFKTGVVLISLIIAIINLKCPDWLRNFFIVLIGGDGMFSLIYLLIGLLQLLSTFYLTNFMIAFAKIVESSLYALTILLSFQII